MAFTNDELLRGAFIAWVIFMALILVATTILVGVNMSIPGRTSAGNIVLVILMVDGCVLLVGGALSAIVMAIGAGLAGRIGGPLRRVRSIRVHVLVYTALGLAVGILFAALIRGVWIRGPLSPFDFITAIPAVAVTVAVPLGWWFTARRALRMDAGLLRSRRTHRDPDAEVEDAALPAAGLSSQEQP
ncbi:MAG: hypothetical protein WAK00_03655 [Microbacterium sp.]|uniref:hypothetical protein n=1 Tax=Microbacterium sp. TaxID=51671 RepID=UPI003BAE49F3